MSYDVLAEAYAAHRRIDANVLDALRSRGPSRALEVGCGTGNYAIALHESAGASCHGLDPSRAMLAKARARTAAVPFVRGVAEALPFADAWADLVFFVDVIHHVTDPARALGEALRVARPGGLVCLATEDEPGIRARLHSRYFPEVVAVELTRYPTITTLRAAMKACGCPRIEEQRTVSPQRVHDLRPYRDKAFSSLHRISEEAHRRGIGRMQRDLAVGPLEGQVQHLLLWGTRGQPRP